MLNVCSGTQLERVHGLFFELFPDPTTAMRPDVRDLMSLVLEPLGFQNVRAQRIMKMSEAYLQWDGEDVRSLPGIGRYGEESFVMFVRGILVEDVRDKELKKYLAWAKSFWATQAKDEKTF